MLHYLLPMNDAPQSLPPVLAQRRKSGFADALWNGAVVYALWLAFAAVGFGLFFGVDLSALTVRLRLENIAAGVAVFALGYVATTALQIARRRQRTRQEEAALKTFLDENYLSSTEEVARARAALTEKGAAASGSSS
jgi:ABC-type uncharacterized transport system permease subunit